MRLERSGLLVVMLVCAACSQAGTPTESLREIAKSRAGNLDVVLLTRDAGLTTGKDTITVEFRRPGDGALVDVGAVKASAMMPMTGMAPMFGPVDVEATGVPGRYVATSELSMVGEWRVSLEWNGSAGRGQVSFSPMVH
jgi:hypothetical protein